MSYRGPRIRKLGKELFINISDVQLMLQSLAEMRSEELEEFIHENLDTLDDTVFDLMISEMDGSIDEIQRIMSMLIMAESQYKLNKVNNPADLEEIFPKISSENA